MPKAGLLEPPKAEGPAFANAPNPEGFPNAEFEAGAPKAGPLLEPEPNAEPPAFEPNADGVLEVPNAEEEPEVALKIWLACANS